MIGSQIIFQIYATHASGTIPESDNLKFPPDILPPYDFTTLGEIQVVVTAQDKVKVGFAHESQNIQVDLSIQSIEQVTESQSEPAPLTVFRLALDHLLTSPITSSTMIIHMYDERAIVSLAYTIQKHSNTYWLQGVSPLGYNQVELGLIVEPKK